MQTAGVSAPQFVADAGEMDWTEKPPLGVRPATVVDCAFIRSNSRPEVAIEIAGQAWRAPTGAARSRRIDGADDVAVRSADPGAPMQQM